MDFQKNELKDLKYAKTLLENPGIAAKIINLIGMPLEKGFTLLPANWSDTVAFATQKALLTAINTAVFTLDHKQQASSNMLHKFSVMATGGIGGLFGLPALALELPVSTTIMLRSIADIARSEGEQINTIEAKMACIEVFAFGGTSKSDDAAESGYFTVRMALAGTLREAAQYIAQKGIVKKSAPPLIRLITQIAERFGVQVSKKMASQTIPIIGSAGGAIINTLFINHFQEMAHGHFIVRRLERKYGQEPIRIEYNNIK